MTARASKKTFGGEVFVDALPISWIRNGPVRNRPVYLFAHGAGAPQTSSFMEMVARGLQARGISVVRFNFPYMERAVREGKRRPPDAKQRLLASCAVMFSLLIDQMPKAQRHNPPLVLGGKSMGGRMMSMLAAGEWAPDAPGALAGGEQQAARQAGATTASQAAGLLYFGYPLHPPGRPESLRTAHLAAVHPPQLFISGSRDSLAHLPTLQRSLQELPQQPTLHLVERGDHSLTTNRKDPTQGADIWLDVAAKFILRHTRTRLSQK